MAMLRTLTHNAVVQVTRRRRRRRRHHRHCYLTSSVPSLCSAATTTPPTTSGSSPPSSSAPTATRCRRAPHRRNLSAAGARRTSTLWQLEQRRQFAPRLCHSATHLPAPPSTRYFAYNSVHKYTDDRPRPGAVSWHARTGPRLAHSPHPHARAGTPTTRSPRSRPTRCSTSAASSSTTSSRSRRRLGSRRCTRCSRSRSRRRRRDCRAIPAQFLAQFLL